MTLLTIVMAICAAGRCAAFLAGIVAMIVGALRRDPKERHPWK